MFCPDMLRLREVHIIVAQNVKFMAMIAIALKELQVRVAALFLSMRLLVLFSIS